MPKLVRAFSMSAALKACGILLGTASTFLLVRLLPQESFGMYSLVMSATTLLTIPAVMGVPEVLVRETAKSIAAGDTLRLKQLLSWARTMIAMTTGIVIVGLVLWHKFGSSSGITTYLLFLLCVLVPLMALNAARSAILVGLGATIYGQFSDGLVKPGALIGLVAGALVFAPEADVEDAVMLYLVSVVAGFSFGGYMLSRRLPAMPRVKTPLWVPAHRQWTVSAVPLAVISGMYLINQQTDIVLLGFLSTSNEVAIYKIASQIGLLVILGQQFVRLVVAPKFAAYWHGGQLDELQKIVSISSRTSFSVAALNALFFIGMGKSLLSMFFGQEYVSGYQALVVLCIAQLVNASFGSTGNLLNMCGHERSSLLGLGVGILANIVVSFALVPRLGAEGAAYGTAAGIVVWNFMLWMAVRKRLEIRPTAFGV